MSAAALTSLTDFLLAGETFLFAWLLLRLPKRPFSAAWYWTGLLWTLGLGTLLGAAIGDQIFFYVFRGRLPRWMARFPSLEQKTTPLLNRVRRHSSLMVLFIRFAPGLRIAITAACAWIDVPALTFSLLNLLSAFVWAIGLLVLVGWLGPTYLARYGLGGWKGAALVGLIILGLFKVLGAWEERAMKRAGAN